MAAKNKGNGLLMVLIVEWAAEHRGTNSIAGTIESTSERLAIPGVLELLPRYRRRWRWIHPI